ncbi:acyltransferase [Caballeronia sp. BCC1704]|uniref:acyltransferase family protein n=1 Tax=Caballeronia sp. BCC1704 TaxID=2676300 RepID=UPI00158BD8F8|nr:acyltransferase [Caballeronia sp. BCC1704]
MKPKSRERIFYIDLIRAISVLLIITFHFNQQIGAHGIKAAEIFKQTFHSENIGSLGITLFIIISGAALMMSSGNTLDLRVYARKRFLAIFPLYWTGFLLTAAILFVLHGHVRGDSSHWKFILTLIGMDGFLYYRIPNYYLLGEWFIGFILVLYVAFPVLRWMALRRPLVLVLAVAAIYAVVTLNYAKLFEIDVVHNPLARLPEFVFGMLFVQYAPRLRWPVATLALAALCIPLIWSLPIPHIYVALDTGIAAFVVLAYIGQTMKPEGRLLQVVSFVSTYSFAAFLVHHNIIGELLVRFMNMALSHVEVYFLYMIIVFLAFTAGRLLTGLTDALVRFFRPPAVTLTPANP